MIQDPDETQGINSRSDLSIVTKTMLKSTREFHMDNGVTLIDPSNTYISLNAKIGKDTIGVSARSLGNYDIGKILTKLGGGGDNNAGAVTKENTTLAKVEQELKQALLEAGSK